MHHQHPELDVLRSRDRYDAILSEVENQRLVAQVQEPWVWQAARFIGRGLVYAGRRLLRYGRTRDVMALPMAVGDSRQPNLN